MKLFNAHFSDRSTRCWIVKLTPEEIKHVESDRFSIRMPYGVYWQKSEHAPEKLYILKQRWEDHTYLVK